MRIDIEPNIQDQLSVASPREKLIALIKVAVVTSAANAMTLEAVETVVSSPKWVNQSTVGLVAATELLFAVGTYALAAAWANKLKEDELDNYFFEQIQPLVKRG